jgi:hypothetical protein
VIKTVEVTGLILNCHKPGPILLSQVGKIHNNHAMISENRNSNSGVRTGSLSEPEPAPELF